MIIQSMLAEFDHEMKTTRSLLERVPDTQDAWKPHQKSRDLGELAAHIATIPQWGWRIARNTTVDVHPPGGENLEAMRFPGTLKNLAIFDQAVRESRAAMEAMSDQAAMEPFTFAVNGQPQFTLPRVAAIRTLLMNHLIHHRGQLSVYLRLNDVPLPSIYGPTADMT